MWFLGEPVSQEDSAALLHSDISYGANSGLSGAQSLEWKLLSSLWVYFCSTPSTIDLMSNLFCEQILHRKGKLSGNNKQNPRLNSWVAILHYLMSSEIKCFFVSTLKVLCIPKGMFPSQYQLAQLLIKAWLKLTMDQWLKASQRSSVVPHQSCIYFIWFESPQTHFSAPETPFSPHHINRK